MRSHCIETQLRDVAIGQTCIVASAFFSADDDALRSRLAFWVHLWLAGDYACDSVREAFFKDAQHAPPSAYKELAKGTGRFILDWMDVDGRRIIEADKPTAWFLTQTPR